MLLVNATRAVAALKDAGWPVEQGPRGLITVGLITFEPASVIHGTRMYDQRAIIEFIKE